MKQKPAAVPFEAALYPELQNDDEFAAEYLKQSLEEDDPRLFFMALKHLVEARNVNISQLARDTNLNRPNLYTILSASGNPQFDSVKTILDSLGFKISIEAKQVG